MKIKREKTISKDFSDAFFAFCDSSIPYDFCGVKSRQLRTAKTLEYFSILYRCPYVYEARINGEFVGGAVFTQKQKNLVLEFVFAAKGKNFDKISALHLILKKALKDSGCFAVESTIQRKKNLKSFIKWIKKHDNLIEFTSEKGVIWKYGRLCGNCGD